LIILRLRRIYLPNLGGEISFNITSQFPQEGQCFMDFLEENGIMGKNKKEIIELEIQNNFWLCHREDVIDTFNYLSKIYRNYILISAKNEKIDVILSPTDILKYNIETKSFEYGTKKRMEFFEKNSLVESEVKEYVDDVLADVSLFFYRSAEYGTKQNEFPEKHNLVESEVNEYAKVGVSMQKYEEIQKRCCELCEKEIVIPSNIQKLRHKFFELIINFENINYNNHFFLHDKDITIDFSHESYESIKKKYCGLCRKYTRLKNYNDINNLDNKEEILQEYNKIGDMHNKIYFDYEELKSNYKALEYKYQKLKSDYEEVQDELREYIGYNDED